MRGGLWVSAGGHRDPPLRLRSGAEPVHGLIGEHCACPGEPQGMPLRVRLMIAMWIPASAGMTKLGAWDAPDNHGGIVPTPMRRVGTG